MAHRSSRLSSVRSARPSRDAPSDVSSASSGSEADVSVSSNASSLAQQPPVAKRVKRGAGSKSRSNVSVNSAKSSQSNRSGLRRSARLAKKQKPAGFYARVPKIDHNEGSYGKRKRRVSTRAPKKHAPAAAHRRTSSSKRHSTRPRK